MLLRDEGEVEGGGAPAALGLVDTHLCDTELDQLRPELLVEAAGLRVADLLRRSMLRVEPGERVDQLLLFVGEAKVHCWGSPVCRAERRWRWEAYDGLG